MAGAGSSRIGRPAAQIGIAAAAIVTAYAASAMEVTRCAGDRDVPPAAVSALESVLLTVVDGEEPSASFFGTAPGAVLSVAGPDWRYLRAAGTADPETGAPIACDMPFEIGSNTKMMTAAILLQLHEEGRLSIDDPLSQHLPEVAAVLPYGADMTLRQLAMHTAGVFSYTDNAPDGTPGIMEGDIADPDALRRGYSMDELVAFAVEHGEPSFAPGAEGEWAYSNTGYILLGLVIEAVEGRPFADALAARILDPLGLDETFYGDDVPSPEIGLPRAYVAAPFDVETTEWNLSQGATAGAVISTVDDMHVFIEALLAGTLFDDPTTLDLMQETVATPNPTIPRYGIGLAEKREGLWGHGGQTLGFLSDVAFAPEHGISVVGWATSSANAMVVGAMTVKAALAEAGVLADDSASGDTLTMEQISGIDWGLVSVEGLAGSDPRTMDPARYAIRFDTSGDFQAQADCNRLLGSWTLDGGQLAIEPGATTRMACPADSEASAFVDWLSRSTAARQGETGDLILVIPGDAQTVRLFFEDQG